MKRIISLTLVFVFLFAFTTAHSESSNKQNEYVLNTSTLEFHKPSCSLVNQIKNNDKEIITQDLLDYRRVLMQRKSPSMYVPMGDRDSIFYAYLGPGNHSIKDYLAMESPSKPSVCSMVVFCLQNSLASQKTNAVLSVKKMMFIHHFIHMLQTYVAFMIQCVF